MKILTLIFFSLIILLCSNSYQKKQYQQEEPVVSAIKMNILYKGIDNPLSIAVPNYSGSELYVTASNGKLSGKNGEYTINPNKLGKLTVNVMALENNDTIMLGKTVFRVKLIPPPKASIVLEKGLRRNSKEISKEDISSCLGLILTIPGFDYIVPYKITQFELIIIQNKCITSDLKSNNNDPKLTDEMKTALNKVQKGDLVRFENIKAISTDKNTWFTKDQLYDVQDIKLKIK